MTATIKLESYLATVPKANVASVTDTTNSAEEGATGTENEVTVSAISATGKLASLVEKLTLRVEQLESAQQDGQVTRSSHYRRLTRTAANGPGREQRQPRGDIICFRYRQKGHIAQECRQGYNRQGN